MASTLTNILQHLATTLRDTGLLARVELGGAETVSAVPRAELLLVKQEDNPAADDPLIRWRRVIVRVILRTREDSAAQGTLRLADLATAVETALLADATRGGLCHHLPLGQATEVGHAEVTRDVRDPGRQSSLALRSPERELHLLVRCHYETALPASYPVITLDGDDLFSTGPSELTVGATTRDTLRRSFPGLDGELAIDLGQRRRTLTQVGRLQAASAAELVALLDAIDVYVDGDLHTLVDENSQTFTNCLLESFVPKAPKSPQTPRCPGRRFSCDYAATYRQLS